MGVVEVEVEDGSERCGWAGMMRPKGGSATFRLAQSAWGGSVSVVEGGASKTGGVMTGVVERAERVDLEVPVRASCP